MGNGMKVVQVVTEQWTNRDGNVNTEVIGLAEDGLLYKWHKGTGKWILWVISR